MVTMTATRIIVSFCLLAFATASPPSETQELQFEVMLLNKILNQNVGDIKDLSSKVDMILEHLNLTYPENVTTDSSEEIKRGESKIMDNFYDTSEDYVILVTGGNIMGEYTLVPDLVYLKNTSDQTCKLDKLPEDFYNHAMTTFNGKPVICGGVQSKPNCYIHNPVTKEWDLLGSFKADQDTLEIHTILKTSQDTFMITGGSSGQGYRKNVDTTQVWTGAEFVDGPKLPRPLIGHCFDKINSTHAILVGGQDSDSTIRNEAYLYDIVEGTFTEIESLKIGRHVAICGKLDNIYVVGAGGASVGEHDYTTETELLDLTTLTWSPGPKAPAYVARSATFTFEDSILSVGGYYEDSKIIEFNLETGWSILEVGLKDNRPEGHSAVLTTLKDLGC